jgi:hypothetical protein
VLVRLIVARMFLRLCEAAGPAGCERDAIVPSFAAIGLLWVGAVQSTDALLHIQHIGMLPSMLAVMLLRLDEYTGHGAHAHA